MRADDKRAAVLLINSQTSPALYFDVCFRGSAKKAIAIGLNGAEAELAVREEGGFVKAHIETLQPWEMKVVLFE